MTIQDDAGFGCAAFGHLASAFVDGELPQSELDRFATHLPGCAPCQRLCAQYRAIDVAAMPAYPKPSETDWAKAWTGVRSAIEADRSAAASFPAAAALHRARRAMPRFRWMMPLAAAAAAVLLVALVVALRPPAPKPPSVATNRPHPTAAIARLTAPGEPTAAGAGDDVLNVSCQAGFEPVVWTLGGDDPMTVVQCQPMEI